MTQQYDFIKPLHCPADLMTAINESGIVSQTCEYVVVNDTDQVTVYFSNQLTAEEQTSLGNMIDNFVCPIPDGGSEPDDSFQGTDDVSVGVMVSYAEMSISLSESDLRNYDWLEIGSANSANSGIIMPNNGLITKVTAHVEKVDARNPVSIDMYVNDIRVPDFLTFGADRTKQSVLDVQGTIWGNDYYGQTRIRKNLTYFFNAGDKLRFRGSMDNRDKLKDVNFTIWYKWRR